MNIGNFITLTSLTSKLMPKHLYLSLTTIKLIWSRNNKTSYHLKHFQQKRISNNNNNPTSNLIHQTVFILATKESGTTYSYLTGRYPIIASFGNKCIVICYYYVAKNIQAIITKTCNATEVRDITMSVLSILNTCRNQPNLHTLDNKA